jgi:hypothetical protein
MSDPCIINVTFTNNNPSFVLSPVSPSSLPIDIVDAIKGEKGEQGIPGDSTSFVWTQSIALDTWTVPHNLNKYPSASIVDTNNNLVLSDVSYVDMNTIQIKHGSAFAGKAYLN